MIRRMIEIDREKCNGCGICAKACHEGAIAMVEGKARLIRDDYCDGLGDCLPACPTGAITFVEREAADYDKAAVAEHLSKNVCPGKSAHTIAAPAQTLAMGGCPGASAQAFAQPVESTVVSQPHPSHLAQWPVQIQLVAQNAAFFTGANLLIAADCAAYAYGDFHSRFMKNHVTLIGCPKLDVVDYQEKLTAIIRENAVKSVTIVRMEVPCCGGLERAATAALRESGKFIPWQVITLSTDGRILE